MQGFDADTSLQYIKVDLGHRNGNFDLSSKDRFYLDMKALHHLNYQYIVPYVFELEQDHSDIQNIQSTYPNLKFLATNIISKDDVAFESFAVHQVGNIKIGLLGLVDPNMNLKLPFKALENIEIKPLVASVQSALDSLMIREVDAVIAFSNMSVADNAILAEEVQGIQVIASCLLYTSDAADD